MTHDDLCRQAVRWLRSPQGGHCSIVYSEIVTASPETPDAIGWRWGWCCVVEAKTSRADFRRDAQKIHRQHPETGMGAFRWYMAPAGLLAPEEMPDKWGLIEVGADRRRLPVVKQPALIQKSRFQREALVLMSVCRRLHKGDAFDKTTGRFR